MEILYMSSLNDIIWCLVDSIQLYYRIYRLWSSSMRGIVQQPSAVFDGMGWRVLRFWTLKWIEHGIWCTVFVYVHIYIYMYIPSYTILQANNNKRHIKICLEGNESLLLVLVVRQGCWWIYWYDWKPAKTERWSNFSSWWLDILQLCGPQNITPDCFFFSGNKNGYPLVN